PNLLSLSVFAAGTPRQGGPAGPNETGILAPTRRARMEVDRRAFLATLGSAAAISAMPDEAKAEALEHYMTEKLDEQATANELMIRRGAGSLFGAGGPGASGGVRALPTLEKMPEKPTLVDFFKYRFAPATHVLQSATDAMKKGEKEETVLACLMHDVVLSL